MSKEVRERVDPIRLDLAADPITVELELERGAATGRATTDGGD